MRTTRRHVLALTLFWLTFLAGAGCGGKPGGSKSGRHFTNSGKLRVLATYSVLGDLVKNVADYSAEVVTLVGPDGDAHTFEPAPASSTRPARACAMRRASDAVCCAGNRAG